MGLLIALLTIACVLITFLVAFYRLWQNPPVLTISLRDVMIPPIPSYLSMNLTLQPGDIRLHQTHQVIPAEVEVKSKEEPIPEEILDYISQESEPHAQDARKRRVRALKLDVGSWDAAFRLLQREDNAIE